MNASTKEKPVKLRRKWKHYGLRTCNTDGTAYGGFIWPETGIVECPDWDARAECGNGLHALLNGQGRASLIGTGDVRWQLVGFDEYVDLGGKVKFPRCEVASGSQVAVTTALAGLCGVVGHYGTATAGHYGTATAGYRGTATAGDSGTATAGYRGTATAGDSGTATAGYYGTATAGYRGTVMVKWYDGNRYKFTIGYVGEDGIKPGTPYRADGTGKLVEVSA